MEYPNLVRREGICDNCEDQKQQKRDERNARRHKALDDAAEKYRQRHGRNMHW